jgi:RNA polymerase sporulation-specific sigma factor
MTVGGTHEEIVSRRVQENRKLVEFAVNRYMKRFHLEGIERDDLVSWGLLGLYYAAQAWDADRGLAFSTLAMTAIERMIVRGVRAERRGRSPSTTLSLDALLNEEVDETTERHLDQLADEGDPIEEQILRLETQLELRQAVAELSPEQQWVLHQRYYQGRTLREVAAETGTTRQAIHFREQSILRTLRRKLSAAA